MASVKYRKRGNRWQLRFRKPGESELTKSFPGTLSEEKIRRKAIWWDEQIALNREDPWEEKRKTEKFKFYLSEIIDKYLEEGKKSGRWKVDGTGRCRAYEANKYRLGKFSALVGDDMPVENLTLKHVNSCIRNLQTSAVTKKSILTSINTFFRWLYREGYKNSLVQAKLPTAVKDRASQIEKQIRGITFYELKRLCVGLRIRNTQLENEKFAGHYTSRQWAIQALPFVFSLMLRRGEINRIYPEDVASDYSQVTIGNLSYSYRPEFIPKGGIKTIPTTKLARRVLKGMNIHSMPRTKPIIKYSNDQVYRKVKEGAEIALPQRNVRLHDLRHGGIMYYRSKGWPESLVSKLARHANSEVTSKMYGGVDPAELRRTLDHFDK